jgi:hypothetical protein
MTKKKKRPGGQAGAPMQTSRGNSKNLYTDQAASKRLRVTAAGRILGPLQQVGNSVWELQTDRGCLWLRTTDLLRGPNGRVFARAAIEKLGFVPEPISQEKWRAVLGQLLADHKEATP